MTATGAAAARSYPPAERRELTEQPARLCFLAHHTGLDLEAAHR